MNYTVVGEGVRKLKRGSDKEAGYQVQSRWYEFLVSPTCPPSKQLHIRGGQVTPSALWFWIQQTSFVPDWTCDFEDESETQMDLVFDNANFFLPLILCYGYDFITLYAAYPDDYWDFGDPPFFNVIGTEVATAQEAEAQIDAWLNGYTQWYREVLPLSGVVLKNDGRTGTLYAILPVDAINRGRSYLYRDCRARHNIFG